MNHILNNPIYHALTSGHQNFAIGKENVWYYEPTIASFAGLKDNSVVDFNMLHEISEADQTFFVFADEEIVIPNHWNVLATIDMYQMVFTSSNFSKPSGIPIRELSEQDIPDMLALTALTKPGPFLSRTIELGNYTGCFDDGKLVAMAGHRFHPAPYIEISAVCTHPSHLGKGYAYHLMAEQVSRICSISAIPFLHVRNDNIAAVKLYQKLGFEIRIPMTAYILKKALA